MQFASFLTNVYVYHHSTMSSSSDEHEDTGDTGGSRLPASVRRRNRAVAEREAAEQLIAQFDLGGMEMMVRAPPLLTVAA